LSTAGMILFLGIEVRWWSASL